MNHNVMRLIEHMDEEINSSKDYAHCYQKYKTENPTLAKKYYEMTNDEMKHAQYFHDMAYEEMKALISSDMSFSEYLEDVWEDKNDHYLDKVAKVKSILTM